MRTLTRMAAVSAALLAVAACGRTKTVAKNDALQKDLQLASSNLDLATTRPGNITLSPVEEMPPTSKMVRSHSLKRASGPKAVRSRTPTVKASPTTEVASEQPAPETQHTVEAPAPVPQASPAPSLPPATRPSPGPAPVPGPDPGAGRAQGGEGGGSVIGSILGGIVGAVILGGGMDGDRCEPHGGRRGRGPYGGGVYIPVYPGGRGRMPIPITP